MKTYDLYGLRFDDILYARTLVEQIMGIQLKEHESSYHCGVYYRCGNMGEEHFILQRNHDDYENEWTESKHQSYSLLLYVNETKRALQIESQLLSIEGVVLLKREEL